MARTDLRFPTGPRRERAQGPDRPATRPRRDAMLAAARSATSLLLGPDSWETSIEQALQDLGRAASAAGSALLRNAETEGGVVASVAQAWTDGPARDAMPPAEPYPPRWEAELSAGRVVLERGASLAGDAAAPVKSLDLGFVAIAPIFASGTWWGSLRLDHPDPAHPWQAPETAVLQIVANTVGAAVARELTEQAQREAAFMYRRLVESIPSMATYMDRVQMDDPGTSIPLYISPQIADLLGYPREAWLTDDELWLQVLHPEDAERMRAADENARRHLQPLGAEYRLIARDGRTVWVSEKSAVVEDENTGTLYWQGIMVDITERKRIEEELTTARRKLLDQTVRAGEEERRRLAAELHDGPVQRLARLGYVLERASLQLEREDLGAAGELVDRAKEGLRTEVQSLRTMMTELRPPVLDQIGLASALRDHAAQVEQASSVQCSVVDAVDVRIDPSLETVLYRVAQEALANVVRHAHARNATVSLRIEDGSVVLEVRDDGLGFEAEGPGWLGSGEHVGLGIMRERVEMAGGRWLLQSMVGSGTTVRATIPLHGDVG
ncbi:MAG TPA: PAS domain-containing protein [Actinomycetota bacterium]